MTCITHRRVEEKEERRLLVYSGGMVSEGKGEELEAIKGRQGGVNEGRGEANGKGDKLYSTNHRDTNYPLHC